MDLGISGRQAIICASSQGLGYACAESLLREGVVVFLNGRDQDRLNAAAKALAHSTGGAVHPVAANIATHQGRDALLSACPQPDILINNNAGPPPGRIEDWTPQVWQQTIEQNMLAAIFLIQSVVRGMQARRFGRIVNITSAMVKSPRPHMALSSAARTGLTAFAKALSFEVMQDNVTINQLLPERIDTPRQAFMAERMMAQQKISHEEARQRIASSIPAKRFGLPNEFGDTCSFICSVQAGFISGQNIQLDGGASPGLL